jgi:hypothetical protein
MSAEPEEAEATEETVTWWMLLHALNHTQRAIRQLERADAAWTISWKERLRVIPFGKTTRTPPELIKLDTDFDDAMTFAISAARHAILGRGMLEHAGLTLPPVTQAKAIVALRDLHEHWVDWMILDPPEDRAADERYLAINAGRRWHSQVGRAPGEHGMGARQQTDGREVVTTWQGVDIALLRRELEQLAAAVEVLEVEAYEAHMLDDVAAAQLVGAEMWARIRLRIAHAPARDEVVRWQREAVLAIADVFQRFDDEGPASLPGVSTDG